MKNKISRLFTLSLFLLSVLLLVIPNANAQGPIPTDRAHINTYSLIVQKKILANTPNGYVITDLVNYPIAVEEDRQRPGIQYLTVADFYNMSDAKKLDAIVTNPNKYYIALNASAIPPLRVSDPADNGDQTPSSRIQDNSNSDDMIIEIDGKKVDLRTLEGAEYEKAKTQYLEQQGR